MKNSAFNSIPSVLVHKKIRDTLAFVYLMHSITSDFQIVFFYLSIRNQVRNTCFNSVTQFFSIALLYNNKHI